MPSWTLLLTLAIDRGELSDFACLIFMTLARIQTVKGEPLLVIKFDRRKNMRCGRAMRRPCLFSDSTGRDMVSRLVHMVRRRISSEISPIGRISQGRAGPPFNRELKKATPSLRYRGSGRDSPRGSLMGYAQDHRAAGSSGSSIHGAWCGRWAGPRSYVDSHPAGALRISPLMATATESDTDWDDDYTGLARIDTRPRKLRGYPVARSVVLSPGSMRLGRGPIVVRLIRARPPVDSRIPRETERRAPTGFPRRSREGHGPLYIINGGSLDEADYPTD